MVDEKYYIKDAALVSRLTSTYNHRKSSVMREEGICRTLTAREFKEPTCVELLDAENEGIPNGTADILYGRKPKHE